MNVRKVSIEQVGEGQIATVSVFFPGNEVLDGSELGKLIEMAREVVGSRDTVAAEEAPQSAPVNPPQTTSRRRAVAATEDNQPSTVSASPAPVEQPQLRRRRTSTEVAPAAQEDPNPPKTDAGAAEVATPRRRSATTIAETKSPSDDNEITVADLRKVASTGARDHGTEAVKMILEVFKGKDGKPAESVADIKPEHRRMFIDAVKGIGK